MATQPIAAPLIKAAVGSTSSRVVGRCLLLAGGLAGHAHAGELLRAEGTLISPVSYDVGHTDLRAGASSGLVKLDIPIQAAKATWLVPGVSYRLDALRFVDSDIPQPPFLHQVDVSLGVLQRFGERWSLFGQVRVGLAGDFAAVDVGALRVGGVLLGSYAFTEAFEMGLGAGVTWAFGQALVLPVVKLAWTPRDDLEVEALLPSYLVVAYRPVDRFRTGLYAEIVGNEYAIRNPDAAAWAVCDGEDTCLDHVAYTDGNVGGFVGVRITGGLWLEVHGGASVYRRFELLDVEDVPVVNGDQRLRPAGFGKLRATWRY